MPELTTPLIRVTQSCTQSANTPTFDGPCLFVDSNVELIGGKTVLCRSFLRLAIAVTCAAGIVSPGQSQVVSPVVNDDRSVTFRTYAPLADTVRVKGIEGFPPQDLARTDNGFWETTVGPLEPELYSYTFEIDGADQVDRLNRATKNWFWLESLVEVPGDPALLHERQAVPHGVLHHHTFASTTAGRDYGLFVYTPPSYDPGRADDYPLVVLLHGFGDDENAWVDVGRTPEIADNMIAAGSIVPSVIVMPYGHPVPVESGRYRPDYGRENTAAMESVVVEEILPLVAARYNVREDADGRAIVGLSMGGGHSLTIGLKYPELFSYVGGFSSATPEEGRDELLKRSSPDAVQRSRRLLWVGCGEDDFLIERNNEFARWLEANGIEHTYVVSDGAHTWLVWRRYLQKFLQLLFRE